MNNTKPVSIFVVFEGIDGSGKSTQASNLVSRLIEADYPTILTQEPSGTAVGLSIDQWLKSPSERSPLTELFLFSAARAEHVTSVIKPALANGHMVICDRFTASTVAYQCYGRGLDSKLVRQVNKVATQGLEPTLTILLDTPLNSALSRLPAPDLDAFEREDQAFHQRVLEGYSVMALESPETWLVLDGTLSKKTLSEAIWRRVEGMLSNL